ncbi:MAG: RluA family pseudouridine synthase [Candidatus Omnitrophota bacterium]
MPRTCFSRNKPIPILYEDEFFVVFDKPAGVLVIPTPKKEKRTLIHIVNDPSMREPSMPRLHPCHRLDRDTSGAIIFAKGKRNQQLMMQEFYKAAVHKVYMAFINGKLGRPQGEMKSEIRDLDDRKFHKHAKAKLAITRYRVLEERDGFSVVEVYPVTGRTNQIRIHFAAIGRPLLGERKYCIAKNFKLKFRRTALHSKEIRWPHPIYKRIIKVRAPVPEDMRGFLEQH